MEHAIEQLELSAIRDALLARVQTPLGTLEVNGLSPFSDRAMAVQRIEAVQQARTLLDAAEVPPVSGAHDVRGALELGEKGVCLEGSALRAAADTMAVGTALRKHLLAHEHDAPALYGLGASLVDLSRVATEVHRSFDRDGTLADDASLELGPLRRRVRSLREAIQEKLSGLLTAPNLQPYLQESYYTVRNDRYVLPIKSSFKHEVRGIVHDASGSGQTVYIEPQVLVDLGNRLKIAQSEQQEEEHIILSRLTRIVSREAEPIRRMMDVIGLCDLLNACARLALDLRAVPVVPDAQPGFHLINARHPLLLLQALTPKPSVEGEPPPPPMNVVGNDFGLEGEQLILVITGPNTGGKTVAMKTIGLFALMARSGLHLPCREGSRIGWFDRVEVAIGDQQSIASNLSTFAAHVKRLVEIIQRSGPRSLVLIDEIAADTDPTQGQAIAQAVLEQIATAGAHVVVTTHFERLKAVPFVDGRFRNAGVGFDAQRHRPTYRVTLDVPQGSSGFEIAQSLGLPGPVVERARALIGEGAGELERLIAQIESRAAALEAAREEAEQAREQAEADQRAAQAREKELEKAIEEVRLRAREELLVEIARTRNEVRAAVAKLQAAAEGESARDAMRAANQVAEELAQIEKAEAAKLAAEAPPKPRTLERVEVGDWVHVAKLGRDAEVTTVDGREAQVAVGAIRIRVPVSSLLPASGPRPKQPVKRAPVARKGPPEPEREPILRTEEIDLRGHTVEESIDRLEAFLDYHYGTPTTHVRIIHGLGTGALREGIREHLKRSGYVKSVRPGENNEGGDGATIVALS